MLWKYCFREISSWQRCAYTKETRVIKWVFLLWKGVMVHGPNYPQPPKFDSCHYVQWFINLLLMRVGIHGKKILKQRSQLNNYFKPPCGTQDNHKTEEFLQFLGYLYAILRNEAINQKMHQLHTILFSAQQVFKRSSHSAHIINRKVIYTIPFKVMTKYSHSHFQVQWRPENQLSVISLSLSAGARGSST